ncbi:MAG: hypothetical protein H0U42_08905, partial [Thermoleophilaceae bacterium]|nr:hypothetical protein [Thermoleophilaceae bacterium]
MSTTSTPGTAPETQASAAIVLALARTSTERTLLQRFAQENHPGAPLVLTSDPALAARLQAAEQSLVVPVRVVWLPPERSEGDSDRVGYLADLRALSQRRPWSRLQPAIVRRRP